ncbi:MAG: hypothetical protein JOZ51_08595 [Chloroflexi bacterium]|nr:hypothetical protein [Chloroflexota bacterium]
MDDLSQDVTQYPWNNDQPKLLAWFPATILAGVIGGIVAPVVFLSILQLSIVLWAVVVFAVQPDGWAALAFFYLMTGLVGAISGAAAGLVFYATRRRPLRRAAIWSIAWGVVGLFSDTLFTLTVGLIPQLLPSVFGLLAFPIVSTTLSLLTAGVLYVVDPDGEEYG